MNGAEYLIEPENIDDKDDHTPKSKRSLDDVQDSRAVPHTIMRQEVKPIVNDHGAISLEILEQIRVPVISDEIDGMRPKRDGKSVFGVELLLGIDYGLYKRWSARVGESTALYAMKQYYALMVNGMDMRYASLQDPDFSVFVRLAGIIFSKGANEVPWTDANGEPSANSDHQMLEASAALSRIRTFDTQPNSALIQHDHFMVFTDCDIYMANHMMGVTGLAYTRAVCTTSSQSIVEDLGGFTSMGTAAHELGHSLGAADHDGEGNAASCAAELQYIMTAVSGSETAATQQNPYLFSSCSITLMKSYLVLENNGVKCLSANARNADDDGFQKLIGTPPGQLYGPDDQCKQLYGNSSYYCAGSRFDQQICLYLWCFEPNRKTCIRYVGAAPGTTCGNKKWCDKGLCTYDIRAPAADDSCVHGDFKMPFYGGATCATLTAGRPLGAVCYTDSTKDLCCNSCKKYYTGITDCEYGDMAMGCSSRFCATFKSLCCMTCQ